MCPPEPSTPIIRIVTPANDDAERRFAHGIRIAEAMLFASDAPLSAEDISRLLPNGIEAEAVLGELERAYQNRGVTLQRVAGKFMFRTAPDLGYLLKKQNDEPRKLSRAALETLGIIAWHQPVTRAEIEELRGVSTHKGTLDILLDSGWIRMRGRRRTPGRPVTFGTTEAFLVQFGLDRISDLPGQDDLQGAGLVDGQTPRGFGMPLPSDDAALRGDEDPLEDDLFERMVEERLEALSQVAPLDPSGRDDANEGAAPQPATLPTDENTDVPT